MALSATTSSTARLGTREYTTAGAGRTCRGLAGPLTRLSAGCWARHEGMAAEQEGDCAERRHQEARCPPCFAHAEQSAKEAADERARNADWKGRGPPAR